MLGEFREADQLGEGSGEALPPSPRTRTPPRLEPGVCSWGEGRVGSQAGACGAWGQRAGGGELAPPREEGRREAAFLELTSGEVNVWLLQMKGPGCFGVL